MGNFWSDALQVLDRNGFIPSESLEEISQQGSPKRGPSDKVTLFEIVRLASGTQWDHLDWSDCSFWEWNKLRQSWKIVWNQLDQGLTDTGNSTQSAVVWAFKKERTQSEIRTLLEHCEGSFTDTQVSRPEPRPEARLMVGQGKMSAALANTFAVLRKGLEVSYGDLISSMIHGASSDEDLLMNLEDALIERSIDRSQVEDQTLIPRLLVRSKIEHDRLIEQGTSTFVSFLETIDQVSNLEGVSDSALQRRLSELAPERNASVKKILERSA